MHSVDIISSVKNQLDSLFTRAQDLPSHTQKTLTHLAELVIESVQTHPTATIATIFQRSAHRYSIHHSVDVAIVCSHISHILEWPDSEKVECLCAALSMNISLLEFQDEMNKQDSRPTPEQRQQILAHPQESIRLLKKAGISNKRWFSIIACHHEKVDGTGYPNRFTRDSIPWAARLVMLADLYCAMVSPREYRQGRPPSEIAKHFLVKQGAGLDNTLVSCLLRQFGLYPPGTMLRLKNKALYVVVSAGDQLTTPKVIELNRQTWAPTGKTTQVSEANIDATLSTPNKPSPLNLPAFFTQIDTQSYLQLEPEADLSKKTQQLIEAIEVPSQETVLATISEQLSNSELDLPKIGSLIDTDVILSGLILKTANSPKFNRGLKITSTLHALSFVDSDHLRNLVTTKPTKNNSKQSNSEELKKTNQHSLAIARISEKIAMAIPNSNPEEAFLTGLFHDIGVFFMNRLFADYWDQIMPIEKTDPLKVSLTEMQKYGTHHGIVGYLKTSSWKLPETVSLAIYHHHNPVIEQINNLEVKNLVAINGVAHSLLNTFLQQEEEIPQASDNTLSYYQQCQTSLDLSEDTIHSVRNHLTELLTN